MNTQRLEKLYGPSQVKTEEEIENEMYDDGPLDPLTDEEIESGKSEDDEMDIMKASRGQY